MPLDACVYSKGRGKARPGLELAHTGFTLARLTSPLRCVTDLIYCLCLDMCCGVFVADDFVKFFSLSLVWTEICLRCPCVTVTTCWHITLSHNSQHCSLGPFRIRAGRATFTAILFCRESGSTRFSSMYCRKC